MTFVLLLLAAAVPNSDTATYERALKRADAGEPQQILFTRGDEHAPEIAHFLAMLKASDEPLPHVVDLELCSQEIRVEWTRAVEGPYVMAVHRATGSHHRYGPTLLTVAGCKDCAKYRSWKKANAKGAVRSNYRYYRYRRGLFRRRR